MILNNTLENRYGEIIYKIINILQNYLVIDMNKSPQKIKQTVFQKNRDFNKSKIITSNFNPIPLDVKLSTNPFLKDEEKYHFLLNKIKQYNKAVLGQQISDSYQCMVYDKLYGLINSLNQMQTKQIQVDRLHSIYQWFLSEERLILQRKNQGIIRYQVTKKYIQQTQGVDHSPQFKKQAQYSKIDYNSLIPSQLLRHKNLPFIRNWRTSHKQLQVPQIRLNQYNRKNLNFGILAFSNQKEVKRAPRITYPKIERPKYGRQYEVEDLAQEQNKNQSIATSPQNPQSIIKINQQAPKQGQKAAQNAQNKQENQQPVQDLGLGQQPNQQPEEQQEIQQQDKLAPRLKSFIYQPRKQTKQEKYSHKRMNQRYIKYQNDFIRKQNQDSQLVQLMHSWAAKKTQLDKQVMKRIQNMGINYEKYNLSYQQPQKQEPFSIQDAKKYGLHKTFELRRNKPDLDLSLPSINNNSQMYEKSIRKDKLNMLKKKFGKMLDLKDYQSREVSQSMCQVSNKRKGFSQILRRHSRSKERLKQLDQVIELKEKLASQKVSVDLTALSKSLCLPQDQQNLPQNLIPDKNLLNNPFWVEPAKKKKKK